MAEIEKKVFLTFPAKLIKEPIIYNLGHIFKVVVNIRGASVSDEIGLVAIVITGDEVEVEKAIEYLRDKDVKIEPIEDEN